MTQLSAERVGSGSENEVPAIAQTGMIVMAMLGVAGGLVVAALSPWLVTRVLSIPPSLAGETLQSFLILSASMPVVILSTGFRGILEARPRFHNRKCVETGKDGADSVGSGGRRRLKKKKSK